MKEKNNREEKPKKERRETKIKKERKKKRKKENEDIIKQIHWLKNFRLEKFFKKMIIDFCWNKQKNTDMILKYERRKNWTK